MSPRELDELLIRLGRADIDFSRAYDAHCADGTAESKTVKRLAKCNKRLCVARLVLEAVTRALAGGRE